MKVKIVIRLQPSTSDQIMRQLEKKLHTNGSFAHDIVIEKVFSMRITSGSLTNKEVIAALSDICAGYVQEKMISSFEISEEK